LLALGSFLCCAIPIGISEEEQQRYFRPDTGRLSHLVCYSDVNRAQRRQQNIDRQPIINVYLSQNNSVTKNVISPAAITKHVLKCGMINSESYGTTNTNVNVIYLGSGDSSMQQQQIIVAATQKRKKEEPQIFS